MSFGTNAKAVIASIAPTLGTALGGPFGALAGTMLAKALNPAGPSGAELSQKEVEAQLLSQSPEALAKIKQAELDFQAKIAELGIDEESLRYGDLDSARKREEALHDSTPKILAYLITAGFFSTLIVLMCEGKPTQGGDVLLVLLGALGAGWTGIISYYFGSSAGSAQKSATLDKIATDGAAAASAK